MKRLALVMLAALAAPLVAKAQPAAPKLVVAISVDQFSADLYSEYRGTWRGGMARLSTGAVFPSGYQSHAATETCPGHSTILTGSRPARTGIIANNWMDLSLQRTDKLVYCSEDPTVPGSSSSNYTVSPVMLNVPTLGDRLKAASPVARVVSVAGKDRAALMMGGRNTDQIWYWSGQRYVTLPDRTSRPVPAAVARVNQQAGEALARDHAITLPDHCRARAAPVVSGGRTVGIPVTRPANDQVQYRASGEFDSYTANLAIALIEEMRLGRGEGTDVLAIGLSATDYVGHRYGTEGGEMCANLAELDVTIERILAALDQTGADYVVALTADHGGHDLPERHDVHAQPSAARLDPALTLNALGARIGPRFGFTGQLLFGESVMGDIYLSPQLSAAQRPAVLAAVRAELLAQPQVEAVFTADELAAAPRPTKPATEWSLLERFGQSFMRGRSGDLVVALKPNISPIAAPGGTTVTTHGSPWNYDRRVPMLFYRPGMTGFEQPLPVETVDILPTLAALIALNVPATEIDGRCLDLEAGAADSCSRPGTR